MPIDQELMNPRMRRLGAIRMGEKDPDKGYPKKLEHWRLTSNDVHLLEAVAEQVGGTPKKWEHPDAVEAFELYTESDVLPVMLAPIEGSEGAGIFEQWMTHYGGSVCLRRCTGGPEATALRETENRGSKQKPDYHRMEPGPCKCRAEAAGQHPSKWLCNKTTYLNVVIPGVPSLGTWSLTTHGANAGDELPQALSLMIETVGLAAIPHVPMYLRLIKRTVRQANGVPAEIQVPTIDVQMGWDELRETGKKISAGLATAELSSGQRVQIESSTGEVVDEPPAPDTADADELAEMAWDDIISAMNHYGMSKEQNRAAIENAGASPGKIRETFTTMAQSGDNPRELARAIIAEMVKIAEAGAESGGSVGDGSDAEDVPPPESTPPQTREQKVRAAWDAQRAKADPDQHETDPPAELEGQEQLA